MHPAGSARRSLKIPIGNAPSGIRPLQTLALSTARYGISSYLSGTRDWHPLAARWILIAGIPGTVPYRWQADGVTDIVQLAISTAGFIFRAGAPGIDPVASLPFCNAVIAASLIVIRVFFAHFMDGIPDNG